MGRLSLSHPALDWRSRNGTSLSGSLDLRHRAGVTRAAERLFPTAGARRARLHPTSQPSRAVPCARFAEKDASLFHLTMSFAALFLADADLSALFSDNYSTEDTIK